MATDVQIPAVESSPAAPVVEAPATESPSNSDISSYTSAQYDNWRKTGEAPKKTPVKEESATSQEPSEAADAAESAPASEAGTETQGKPAKRTDAQTRIKELLADKKRLESELANRKPDVRAESSPSPVKQVKLEAPQKPDFATWKGTFEEFEAAKDKYYEDIADYKAKKSIEDFKTAQIVEAGTKRLNDQLAEGRKRYENFDTVIQPVIQKLTTDAQIAPEVGAVLNASPVLVDLLYAIGSDEASLKDFIDTARTDPAAAIRKAVITEQLVIQALSGKSGKEPVTGRGEDGKFVAIPEKKTVSGAPPPPIEVNGKGTPPADEVESAAKSGDVRAYMESANRRDLARGRRG